jgi:hypothetical protein
MPELSPPPAHPPCRARAFRVTVPGTDSCQTSKPMMPTPRRFRKGCARIVTLPQRCLAPIVAPLPLAAEPNGARREWFLAEGSGAGEQVGRGEALQLVVREVLDVALAEA